MIKAMKLLLAICLISILSACSSLSDLKTDISESIFGREEENPPAELEDIQPSVTAKVLWSARVSEAEGYEFFPVADIGSVFAVGASGEIVKLDAKTGAQQWRIDTNEKISGGVGVGAGLVLAGTSKGQVLAYDLTGKLVWKSQVSTEILSAPKASDDVVVVRAGDSKIFGLNAADGTRKWIYERTTPSLSLRSSAGVVIAGNAVFAGFAGGKLVALRLSDGKVGWETSVAQPKGATEIERIADITSLPVVDGPLVYAVAYQGRIAAVERSSGKMVWNRDISSFTGINVADARVYLSHALGSAYSLEYNTGKTYWRQGALTHRKLTAPLPVGDIVAVGDVEGYVHLLKREDGSFAGRIQTETSPIMAQMIELDSGVFLAQTRNGGLYAISIK